MPCACRLPIEEYPDAQEWGPILWSLLHGLAERSGKPVTALYAEDERREWIRIFKQTGEIIPCKTCKEHYNTYLEQHPVDALKSIALADLHEWVRTWFWEIHEWVNGSLEKPSFPKGDLESTYKTTPLRAKLKQLDKPMTTAIHLSGNQMKKYTEWKTRYTMLLSILGI